MHNLSYGNEFDFQDNELERKSQSVDMKGCAPRLLLKQREKQLGHGLFNAKNPPEVLTLCRGNTVARFLYVTQYATSNLSKRNLQDRFKKTCLGCSVLPFLLKQT